jgi:hypothetical protein
MSWRDWLPGSGEMELHERQVRQLALLTDRVTEISKNLLLTVEIVGRMQDRLTAIETILINRGLAIREDVKQERLQ